MITKTQKKVISALGISVGASLLILGNKPIKILGGSLILTSGLFYALYKGKETNLELKSTGFKKGYQPLNEEWIKWYDKVGMNFIKWTTEELKYPLISALFIIAHANRETGNGTGDSTYAWTTNNWWGFGALKSRNQKGSNLSKFANFNTLKEGYNGYIDRITSNTQIKDAKADDFNPSFPELGKMLKIGKIPSENDLLKIFRIDTQKFVYNKSKLYPASILMVLKSAYKRTYQYVNLQIISLKKQT
ncbi:MAG TPA: hypothetical protein DCS19_10470, partial [Flavobacterium sp.]|nr:hypothetical protein [Flavobacterium sp.]